MHGSVVTNQHGYTYLSFEVGVYYYYLVTIDRI